MRNFEEEGLETFDALDTFGFEDALDTLDLENDLDTFDFEEDTQRVAAEDVFGAPGCGYSNALYRLYYYLCQYLLFHLLFLC